MLNLGACLRSYGSVWFLIACWLCVATGLAPASAPKPNVLFLFADDMRADSIAALGNPTAITPNLDRLVQHGMTFQNAYCFGGNSAAVCTPSRNMLLSGNAYFRWKDYVSPANNPKGKSTKGMFAPGDGATNFPAAFNQAGYHTYHHGKRANTAPLIQAKFQTNLYLKNDEAERQSGQPGKEIADAAIDFLKKPSDKPFFMYLAFGNPHDPRVAAPEYFRAYDAAKIPLPKNYKPVHPFDNGEMSIRDEQLLPWPRTESAVRETLHAYYATLTALDYHMGRVLKTLEETGKLQNTIVVFSADQGISIGSHGLLGKQNLYDHAMKAPLIVAGPGITRGSNNALVYLFDIFPTVAVLAGLPVPQGIDGQSAHEVVTGQKKAARPELMLAYRSVQRAYRDERFKIIVYPAIHKVQLFDLASDPDELKDLSQNPEHAGRLQAMQEKLKTQQTHYGDDLPLKAAKAQNADWTPPQKKTP
jgi:arylsulfatase A-like enzyme